MELPLLVAKEHRQSEMDLDGLDDFEDVALGRA